MSLARTHETRRQIRALRMADIEATWPDRLRQQLHTNTGDHRIYGIWRETFSTGLFDPLWPFLDPTSAAVDVGALLGQYSLTLAAWSTRCLCIEPLEQYAFMASTLPPNCLWQTVAAGEQAGRATIRSPAWPDGGVFFGLSSLVQHEWAGASGVREQATDVRPLDVIIPEALGDERVGFIKIDVEGYELQVLRGALDTLRRHRPALLIETSDVEAVAALMRTHGYRGLFFFQRRLFDLSAYRPAIHRDPRHVWSAERPNAFDPDLVMSDLYFVPAEFRADA